MRAGRPKARAAAAVSGNRDIGNIAIIEDSDGVVEKLNQFNLDSQTLTFTPSAGSARYRYAVSGLGYDTNVADQGSPVAALDDDDARAFSLPFAFPFFGVSYTKVFLNSDGNLTFTAAESGSTSRSVGRLTGGPPRIAVLFDDLDPSRSPGSVRFYSSAGFVAFSWVGVPEYSDGGLGFTQTFQARLYVDGRIQLSYGGVRPKSAVVGIAPGGARAGTAMVSFVNDASGEYPSAVVERFGDTQEVDIVALAQKFYETHEDAYDYLVVYNNMGIPAQLGAVAYEATVRSNGTGYGVQVQDSGQQYGSVARLRSVMNMGTLDLYPGDPNGTVTVRGPAADTPLTVLGHEAGHLFLAFASVPDPDDSSAKPMIGFGGSHWSFVFNSEASLDEGEQITETGKGRFLTGAVTQGYAPLDRYLMGFAPPGAVPDTFVVLDASVSALSHPRSGVAFTGSRFNVSVGDVIQAMGRRTPDDTVAQHRFRFGFILVAAQGTPDSALSSALAKVEGYRQQFGAKYGEFAGNLASAETTLNRSLRLSLFPAAGVVAGGKATATFSVTSAPKTDLAIRLTAPGGFAQAPETVTIAAGTTSASFAVGGTKAGVEELLATPADSSYETAFARVQVAAASQLTLRAVPVRRGDFSSLAGTPEITAVRLSDVNGLPYPGARVVAVATDGTVNPAVAITDSSGDATFEWVPGTVGTSQLKVSLEAAPSVALTLNSGSGAAAIGAVVNAASFAEGVSPGSLATLFGTSLAGATVTLNGAGVRPFYASDTQVNFYVPAETPLGDAVIRVSTASSEVSTTIRLVSVQPGIFSGAVVHADTGISALTTPARAGEFLTIYCTGLGPTQNLRGLAYTTVIPTVYLGPATISPSFSGLAPDFTGLYQVNVQVPAGLPSGTLALSIASGNAYSNEVKIAVQ